MKRWTTVVAGLVAATCLASAGIAPATGQDTTMDRAVSIDQGSRYGRAWSESTSGGSLAWSEGYYTDSYVDLYEATGAQYWLDKMVDHTDRMMANAVDHDGDGNKGWADFLPSHNQIANDTVAVQGAPTTSPDLLANGSFEAGVGVPTGWAVTGASGQAVRSTTTGDVYAGTAGAVVASDGTNANRMTQDFSYSPRTTYQVEAFLSMQTEQTEALVEIYNATTGLVIASTRAHHVGFERYVFTFVAPASGSLQVRLSLQSYGESGHRARFDDVSIRAGATPAAQVLANRGFDSVDAGDPTCRRAGPASRAPRRPTPTWCPGSTMPTAVRKDSPSRRPPA